MKVQQLKGSTHLYGPVKYLDQLPEGEEFKLALQPLADDVGEIVFYSIPADVPVKDRFLYFVNNIEPAAQAEVNKQLRRLYNKTTISSDVSRRVYDGDAPEELNGMVRFFHNISTTIELAIDSEYAIDKDSTEVDILTEAKRLLALLIPGTEYKTEMRVTAEYAQKINSFLSEVIFSSDACRFNVVTNLVEGQPVRFNLLPCNCIVVDNVWGAILVIAPASATPGPDIIVLTPDVETMDKFITSLY